MSDGPMHSSTRSVSMAHRSRLQTGKDGPVCIGIFSAPIGCRTPPSTLPRRREVIAYCRGPYCVYADDAVRLLRERGLKARRLDVGYPEWRRANRPIEIAS